MTKRDVLPPRRRGAIVVETAIVLPFFLLLFLGIFEYCRFLMMRNLADHAVCEAARYAVVHTYDLTTADIQAKALSLLAGQEGQLSVTSSGIQVFRADPTNGANLGAWT